MAATLKDVRSDEGSCSINLDSALIKVVVGSTNEAFHVHESVIRKSGTFFDSALRKEWKEGQERAVELPEDDPGIFEHYARWLYTGRIFCKAKGERNFQALCNLYVLGEKLLDATFQDYVIDAILAATHDRDVPDSESPGRRFPHVTSVDNVYRRTPVGSPIRRLMVDLYVHFGYEPWMKSWADNPDLANQDFLVDLTIAMYQKRELKAKDRQELQTLDFTPGCTYHLHSQDEPCGSNGRQVA